MQPITRSTSDASSTIKYSNPVVLDTWVSPFSVSLAVAVTGTVNYTVQYTYDADVSASGNWLDLTALASKTATLDSALTAPVTAVRLKQASGTGSCILTVLQAGGEGP